MKLSNKMYDVAKFIMLIAPSLTAFVIGLVTAILTGDWKAIVTAAIGGIGTLAGAFLEASSKIYWDEQNAQNAQDPEN